MMNEEEYLRQRMGKKNPFTVPEGYFDQIAGQVMQRLPQQQPARQTVFKRLQPWLYAAACTCAAVFVAALLFNKQNTPDAQAQQIAAMAEQENTYYYSDTYIEEEADYAMVDNQEIYACLLADM